MVVKARTNHNLEQLDIHPTVIYHKLNGEYPSKQQRKISTRFIRLLLRFSEFPSILVFLILLCGSLENWCWFKVSDCFIVIVITIVERESRVIIKVIWKALLILLMILNSSSFIPDILIAVINIIPNSFLTSILNTISSCEVITIFPWPIDRAPSHKQIENIGISNPFNEWDPIIPL